MDGASEDAGLQAYHKIRDMNEILDEDVFDDDEKKELINERELFDGWCYYDSKREKLVYYTEQLYNFAYEQIEARSIRDYVWTNCETKSAEEVNRELRNGLAADWIKKEAAGWRDFWLKTHEFIFSEEHVA